EEHQDRETYLNHYLQFMRETWTKVPPEQLEEACTHVHDHDYPETFSTLQNMAIAAGLHTQRIISRYGQHYTLLFSPVNLPKI
ncbi:MAG TPA: class I SAM-dependent methyltransferase, partial [Nitrosomonas sp.]|nr:class I SAM-dependent methyltransferase [Nitrosomonas sp.]